MLVNIVQILAHLGVCFILYKVILANQPLKLLPNFVWELSAILRYWQTDRQ